MRAIQLYTILVGTSLKDAQLGGDIFLVVNYSIELLGSHTQQIANVVGQ